MLQIDQNSGVFCEVVHFVCTAFLCFFFYITLKQSPSRGETDGWTSQAAKVKAAQRERERDVLKNKSEGERKSLVVCGGTQKYDRRLQEESPRSTWLCVHRRKAAVTQFCCFWSLLSSDAECFTYIMDDRHLLLWFVLKKYTCDCLFFFLGRH